MSVVSQIKGCREGMPNGGSCLCKSLEWKNSMVEKLADWGSVKGKSGVEWSVKCWRGGQGLSRIVP